MDPMFAVAMLTLWRIAAAYFFPGDFHFNKAAIT
jgi:hypothetical protein